MSENKPPDKTISLTALLEAMLFSAPGSVSISQLASALETTNKTVESALEQLDQTYKNGEMQRGLQLQRHHGRIQLTTAPEAAEAVQHFLGLEATFRLSRAALEALSIVAYQEPVTRPQVDAIRGVNSDAVLKSLLRAGLIEEIGRADSPGRPILYSTTPEFLSYFGLGSMDELPPLEESREPAPPESEPELPT
jgi:segregation and condensation protein B